MDNSPNIDVALVTRLIADQFPRWHNLVIRPVAVQGWDNRTYRLGSDMLVRLPSAERYAAKVVIEQQWLPKLAPFLPYAIPSPIKMGRPSKYYPWPWSIYGDISAGNLLINCGKLCAVIDFGGLAVGDPACDLVIMWNLLRGTSQQVFRSQLNLDDATWARARGWALWKALIVVAGHNGINQHTINESKNVLDQLLS